MNPTEIELDRNKLLRVLGHLSQYTLSHWMPGAKVTARSRAYSDFWLDCDQMAKWMMSDQEVKALVWALQKVLAYTEERPTNELIKPQSEPLLAHQLFVPEMKKESPESK